MSKLILCTVLLVSQAFAQAPPRSKTSKLAINEVNTLIARCELPELPTPTPPKLKAWPLPPAMPRTSNQMNYYAPPRPKIPGIDLASVERLPLPKNYMDALNLCAQGTISAADSLAVPLTVYLEVQSLVALDGGTYELRGREQITKQDASAYRTQWERQLLSDANETIRRLTADHSEQISDARRKLKDSEARVKGDAVGDLLLIQKRDMEDLKQELVNLSGQLNALAQERSEAIEYVSWTIIIPAEVASLIDIKKLAKQTRATMIVHVEKIEPRPGLPEIDAPAQVGAVRAAMVEYKAER